MEELTTVKTEVLSSDDESINQDEEETPQEVENNSDSEEDPIISDPAEGCTDDIAEEDLFGDILNQFPKETTSFDSVIVVKGLPQTGPDSLDKYKSRINKIFGKIGPIANSFYPVDEKGHTKGCIFLEYTSPLQAQKAVRCMNNCKQYRLLNFQVKLLSDYTKYKTRPGEREPPAPVVVTGQGQSAQVSQNTEKQPDVGVTSQPSQNISVNVDETSPSQDGNPPKRARISTSHLPQNKGETLSNNKEILSEGKTSVAIPDKKNQTLEVGKRALSSDSEPSAVNSKFKTSNSKSQLLAVHKKICSETDKKHLMVAIIDRNHPLGKLNTGQAQVIMSHLRKELHIAVALALAKNTPAPNFNGMDYSCEILRMTCGDQMSLDWLKETTARLPQLCEGAKLTLTSVDRLPRMTKGTMWIPGKPEELSVVVGYLRSQNRWVDVAKWSVLDTAVKTDPTNPGRLMVFGVTDTDKKIIEEKGGHLHYEFHSIPIKFKKESFNGLDSVEMGRNLI